MWCILLKWWKPSSATLKGSHNISTQWKQRKLVIYDDYMHALALKLLLQTGEYKTETQEWPKIQEDQRSWAVWKTTFQEASVDAPKPPRRGRKQFGGSAIFGASPENKSWRARPAHKSNDELAGGILRQYCSSGHTNGSKRRAARVVSGWSGDFSGHCCQTAAIN